MDVKEHTCGAGRYWVVMEYGEPPGANGSGGRWRGWWQPWDLATYSEVLKQTGRDVNYCDGSIVYEITDGGGLRLVRTFGDPLTTWKSPSQIVPKSARAFAKVWGSIVSDIFESGEHVQDMAIELTDTDPSVN